MSQPCPAEAQLEQLLTNRMDPGTETSLEQHLEQCPRCQQELDRLTAAANGLGQRIRPADPAPLPATGEAFVRRLMQDTELLSASSSAPPAEDQKSGSSTKNGSISSPARNMTAGLPVIAGYEILHEVGRGGMGVIYKARQVGLNRLVALKMIRTPSAGGAALSRFRTEAEAVARLQHPHIVRVYDCGEAEGQPYLALEFIDGGSLKARLDGTPWPAQAAARLIETVARAVDTAHRHHIIHRDLKPSNILLAACSFTEGAPPQAADCTPKIADFGLAKMLDREGESFGSPHQTRSGAILGTPSYMAPEQAGGRRVIGPAADVYALGAILYELLTGRPPFTAETPLDILVQVMHEEPVAVTRLRPKVPRDLATITHKCLQKDPDKRYRSALDLADDLRRYQEDQPIKARPVGAGERIWKWARRCPAVALLSAAVVLVTFTGIGLVGWKWREAVANANAEARARRQTERLLVGAEVDNATTRCERGDIPWGLLLLAQSLEKSVRLDDPELERVIRADLAGWRHVLVVPRAALPHADWAWDVTFSPDGRTVLTGSKDKTAQLWDAVTGQPIGPAPPHPYPVWTVAYSPDGRTLLTGCGTDNCMNGEARLWDAATGQPLGPPLTTEGTVNIAAFSPDGTRILTVCRGQAKVWETPRRGDAGNPPPSLLLAHPGPVWTALFSPDGRIVLTGGPDGSAQLWETTTGIRRGFMERHPGPVVAAAFRPDGKFLATATLLPDKEKKLFVGGAVALWNTKTCKQVEPAMPHAGEVKAMAFSPDGRILLTGGIALPTTGPKSDADFKGEARLWNVETLEPLGPALAHNKPVRAVAFSPDGRTFLTGSEDQFARVWLTATQTPIDFPRGHRGTVRALAYSPDGQLIATGSAGDQGSARVWTAPVGQASGSAIPQFTAALSPDGKTLLGQSGNDVRLWDVLSRKPGVEKPLTDKLRAAAFSTDGKTLITVQGQRVEFRRADTGQPNRQPWEGLEATRIMPDIDGKTLWTVARAEGGEIVQRWQLDTGKPVGEPLRHPAGLAALAQSDDGRLLLACGKDGVWIWETATGKLIAHHLQQEDWMWTAAFSPGGKTFVAAGRGEMAQLWESETGKPIGPPLPHPSGVLAAAFSQDGRTLLTGCRDGTARLWDVATGKSLGPPLPHRGGVMRVGFLPGGNEAFTSSETAPESKDGVTAFWDVPAPWPGEPGRVLLELQVLTGTELDERGAVRKLSAEEWQQRRHQLQTPNVRVGPR